MHKSTELQQIRDLHYNQAPLRQMSSLPIHAPLHLGIAHHARIHGSQGNPVCYSDFQRRTPALFKLRPEADLTKMVQKAWQGRWLSPQILRLYGIRKPLRATPLPYNLIWQADNTGQAQNRRRKVLSMRSSNTRHLGPRTNLFEGLSYWSSPGECGDLRSKLHLEKHLAHIRYAAAARMGPPEQESIYRQEWSELAYRRNEHKQRAKAHKSSRDDPGQNQDFWQILEDTD